VSAPGFLALPPLVHRLAVGGLVRDAATGQPLAGAAVAITAGPEKFQERLRALAIRHGAAWTALPERPDRARAAADGSYRFIDLPDGSYQLRVEVPGGRYQPKAAAATVAAGARFEALNIDVNPAPEGA